jgi:hypothetical protein
MGAPGGVPSGNVTTGIETATPPELSPPLPPSCVPWIADLAPCRANSQPNGGKAPRRRKWACARVIAPSTGAGAGSAHVLPNLARGEHGATGFIHRKTIYQRSWRYRTLLATEVQ